MNNIVVRTYLRKLHLDLKGRKIMPGDFFSIDNEQDVSDNSDLFTGHLMYVEGAIIIDIYGKKILDFKHYDYPFWCWGQLHNQLDNIVDGSSFEMAFLETPRKLVFESSNVQDYLVKHMAFEDIESKVLVSKRELSKYLIHSAIQSYTAANRYGIGEYSKWIEDFEEVYKIL